MYLYGRDEPDDGGIPRDPKRVPSRPSSPTPLTPGILYSLVSIIAVCGLFLLYRRSGRLVVIGQPLKNLLGRRQGRIRLEEDGPGEDFRGEDGDERLENGDSGGDGQTHHRDRHDPGEADVGRG